MHRENRIQREHMLRRAVLAGDENAWRVWCQESFEELDRFIIWRCGGRRDQADDIVQETWLTAVRQIRTFRPEEASFLAWLRGIATNVRRNYLRQTWRKSKWESQAGRERSYVSTSASITDEREQSIQIAAALDTLPERQEAVLRAKYLDGQSVAEIAAAWKGTPKAIESLLSRARDAFREQFERLAGKAEG